MAEYKVRRDEWGYAAAITRDGWDVLHLVPGSMRNEEEVDEFVAYIARLESTVSRLKEALEYYARMRGHPVSGAIGWDDGSVARAALQRKEEEA